MTIAAGFVCSDGVVIAADTLLSANFRQQGPKVWTWSDGHGNAVVVSGAGPYVLLKLAKEAIFRHLRSINHSKFLEQVKYAAVEPALQSIHDDHIDKASDWDRTNGYMLSLVVGCKTKDGWRLYETDKRACSEVQGFVCIGSGAPVANYVASTLFSPSLSVLWGQVIGAYVIQQTKAYGDDCGGETDIALLTNTAGFPVELSEPKIRHLEWAATNIHEGLGRMLFAATDSKPKKYQRAAEQLREAVTKSRNAVLLAQVYDLMATQSASEPAGPAGTPARPHPKRGRKSRPPSQE